MGADFLNPAAAVELVAGVDVSSNFNDTAVSRYNGDGSTVNFA